MSQWCQYGKRTKKKYNTENEAYRALMNLWGADPTVDLSDMHVYVCPMCNKFHVGHISKYAAKVEKR